MLVDVTVLTLAHAAQTLKISGEVPYHGLWEYFVQAILQYRIAPYFPQLSPPTVAQHPSWTSPATSSTFSASTSDDCTNLAVSTSKKLSTCAYMVQCIRALTAQPARAKHSHVRESLHSDPKALRGFFKLVAQYVLFHGEEIEAEDLEDLEDACGLFRRKTVSLEVRNSTWSRFLLIFNIINYFLLSFLYDKGGRCAGLHTDELWNVFGRLGTKQRSVGGKVRQ